MSSVINDIRKTIDTRMEDQNFLKNISIYLKGQNKEEFNQVVKENIQNIYTKIRIFLESNYHFLAGGIHYISPSLGDWFRFNFGDDINPTNTIEQDLLESAYNAIPKEYNLTTLDELKENVQYVFKENKLPKVKSNAFLLNKQRRDILWRYMFYPDVNYYKYVTGGNYLDNRRKSIKMAPHYITDLKPIIDEYRKHLANKADCFISSADKLFRLLTFSCFFTLRNLNELDRILPQISDESGKIKKIEEKKEKYAFGLVIPFRVQYSDSIGFKASNYGGFGGIFTEPLKPEEIEDVEIIFHHIIHRLICLEMNVFARKGTEDLIVTEDIIRLCTRIDNEKIEKINKRYSEYLRLMVESHSNEFKFNIKITNSIANSMDKEKISSKLIGCNENYIDLLERILLTLKTEYFEFKKIFENGEPNVKKHDSYCSTIFLYGEEGVGKEILAKICHLINPRCFDPQYILRAIQDYYKKYYLNEKNEADLFSDICQKVAGLSYDSTKGVASLSDEVDKFFNYRNVNMATLDNQTFTERIFGEQGPRSDHKSESLIGELEICSVLNGTLFMDEIDKLDSKLANQLLKVLESPYTFQRHGDNKNRKANMLIVFASNKKLEEFSHDKFSSAFVYRIGRNYFEIPPLRMRKEDIALFLVERIKKNNEEKSAEKVKIESVDINGLRLICELPWLNNYRGLEGLIRTLFTEREIRKIKSPDISFDEIIRVISKLELLKKKLPR